MHMDVDTAVSVFHLKASAGKGEIFPPCPWMCPLSPCTRGSSTGCPGLQRKTMGVSWVGCLAQSLSIKFPGEASACGQPPGTLGSWAWQWRESLCVVVTSSLDHTSWEVPPSLMLLEILGGVSAHQQRITCWPCLVCQGLPRILLLLVSPAAKMWLLPWGGSSSS